MAEEWKLALHPLTYRPMPGFDPNAFYEFRNGEDDRSRRSCRYNDFGPYANVWDLQYRDPIATLRPA